MRPLMKTTIIIWSEVDEGRDRMEIDALARDAVDGDSYCSERRSVTVEDPESDSDWDGTEFFGVEDQEENDY